MPKYSDGKGFVSVCFKRPSSGGVPELRVPLLHLHRRRIGKTTLIKHSFTSIPFLYFFVGKKSENLLCQELVGIVREALGEDLGDFTSFRRLFEAIMNVSKRRNFTLVLDEFQNLKIAGEAIFSDIQDVWDSNKEDSF